MLLALGSTVPAVAHEKFDHPAAPGTGVNAPLSSAFIADGAEGTEWELITTLATGNPHTDLDYFTQGDTLYASVGTLAFGANGGGQTIVKLMEGGEVTPEFVAAHPSASCLAAASGVTGLQHDVEATPKGDVPLNTVNPYADRRDAQLLLDTTDAPGRCHDNANAALQSPLGGVEIIDIRDVTMPFELALTSHAGEAHTVNVDPKRPHIAFVASSDGGNVNEEGQITSGDLHTVEIIDLSSCMDLDPASSVQDRRDACNPVVYRMPWDPQWTRTTNAPTAFGACHEVEIYPNDLFTCAGLSGSVVLDLSGAFDDNGTPNNFLDDTVNGDPLPCARRDSTSVASATTAKVVDCVTGEGGADLTVAGWQALGSPSVDGVELVGFVNHDPASGPAVDVSIAHEAELTHSGRYMIVSDERGGGVTPGGASCPAVGSNVGDGNGGLHVYAVDQLLTEQLGDAPGAERAEATRAQTYATTPEGEQAIYRAIPSVPGGTFCTAHVFHQIEDQNRIFMGWYSQGTRVVDYVEHEDGTFSWHEVAYFTPENADQWVSAIFHSEDNGDGTFTYYGATGDFMLAGYGRNAIDVYKVTLPAPAQQFVDSGQEPPAPPPAPTPDDGGAAAPDDGTGMPATGGGATTTSLMLLLAGLAVIGSRRLGLRH
jgi:hypothetical protein